MFSRPDSLVPRITQNDVLHSFCTYRKLRWVLTNRLVKFFQERARKDAVKYLDFYNDYGLFFREGIVTTPEQKDRVSDYSMLYDKSVWLYRETPQ